MLQLHYYLWLSYAAHPASGADWFYYIAVHAPGALAWRNHFMALHSRGLLLRIPERCVGC